MKKQFKRVIQWLFSILVIRKFCRILDVLGSYIIRTRIGALFIGTILPRSKPILCSDCFSDNGLRLQAEVIGIPNALPCPNCGSGNSKKLTPRLIEALVWEFFVHGSFTRTEYGGASYIKFNKDYHHNSNRLFNSPILNSDAELIGKKTQIGLFLYGPRLWMIGKVAPLEALQEPQHRDGIINRIIKEYPQRTWTTNLNLYRLRRNPKIPSDLYQYDSPEPCEIPDDEKGRLNSSELPVMYCSQDIEGCIHECRVTVEDELYLATLNPVRDLKLLDLTELLEEENVTEFDSLDMAVHMLFYAPRYSYDISREIAKVAKDSGFDGLIYPSYYSQVRTARMPYEAVYGISVRKFPKAADYVKSGVFPNIALFGRPLRDGMVNITCINRLVLRKVKYDIRFGPVPYLRRWFNPKDIYKKS